MDPSVRLAHHHDRRAQQVLYEKDAFVGEGAFGVVLKAHVKTQQEAHTGPFGATATNTHNTPKKYVAIKQMMNKREGQGIPIDAIREIKVLKELRHENIVSLDRIFTRPDKQEIDLVYEYAEHDLAEIIKVNRAKAMNNVQPDPRFVKSVLQQVLTGLAFLHQSWIVHRDMKPANILLTDVSHAPDGTEEGGKVKIADFGLARIFQSPLRRLSDDGEVVTIWYRAPELLLGSKHYTRAIDIFAVGCIFFELLTCAPLFPGIEAKQPKTFQENQVKEVFKYMGKPTLEQWKGMADCPHYPLIKGWPAKDYGNAGSLDARLPRCVSDNARHLLRGMLTYDPSLRLTAEQALQHPYFRDEPRPDRNVFRDQYGSCLQYPQRVSKPVAASKRGRETEPTQHHAHPHAHVASHAASSSAAIAPAAAAAAPHPYAHSLPPQHPAAAQLPPHHSQPLQYTQNVAAMQQRFQTQNAYVDPELQEQMQPNKIRRM